MKRLGDNENALWKIKYLYIRNQKKKPETKQQNQRPLSMGKLMTPKKKTMILKLMRVKKIAQALTGSDGQTCKFYTVKGHK